MRKVCRGLAWFMGGVGLFDLIAAGFAHGLGRDDIGGIFIWSGVACAVSAVSFDILGQEDDLGGQD